MDLAFTSYGTRGGGSVCTGCMGADEDEIEGPLPAGSSGEAAAAAALQLDLDDDEFADLALGDDEPAAADSDDALELDDLDVVELEGHAAHEDEVEDEDEDEGVPTLYLELDGRFCAVEKEKFIIGRVATMCDLAIRDVNVSRQHCAIERRADGYYIVDLGSINGIVIDGKRTDNHRIREGEVLVLSGHELAASFHAPLLTEPDAAVAEELEYPHLTGEFPPVPQAEHEHEHEHAHDIEPDPEPAPAPAPVRAPAPAPLVQEPVMAMQMPLSFEQRVEQRLDYMAQQLAYLQQTINALYVRVEQLQGVAALADMIQGRLAHKGRDR